MHPMFLSEAEAVPFVQQLWGLIAAVAGAGAVGGIVNALLSDNNLILPSPENGVLKLGFVGNIVIGSFAALITWGLYGPLSQAVVLGQQPSTTSLTASLTLTALVGAALAGAGGAKVVSNEIDKRFLRAAGVEAATKGADTGLAATLATASPSNALVRAQNAP